MNFWRKWKEKDKDREKPFTGQIPVKILFKVLSQRKKPCSQENAISKTQRHYLHHTIPGFFYSLLKKIASKIKKLYVFFIYSPLKHYSNLFILFIIYFLLWHPGLDNRELPRHSGKLPSLKNIPIRPYIVSSANVYLEIDCNHSYLYLFMKEKKIASYSVNLTSLIKGKYRIVQIKEYPKGAVLAILKHLDPLQKESFVLLKGTQLKVESSIQCCIELDDVLWDALHPYLSEETVMLVR